VEGKYPSTGSQGLLETLASISPRVDIPVERDPSQVVESPLILNPHGQAVLPDQAAPLKIP
jgi:hypothetical protein